MACVQYENMEQKSYSQPHFTQGSPRPSSTRAVLKNLDLWNKFHKHTTEMILTKHGRRMFPTIELQVSGLDPNANYYVMMELLPVNNNKYKYSSSAGWNIAGKEEQQIPRRCYMHPYSPATGRHWMSQTVSLAKVKLTNTISAKSSDHIVLSSLNKYIPKIHIVKCQHFSQLQYSPRDMFVFPETEFIAVTAYQNEEIIKLKINNNPFAKGFRESGQADSKRKRLLKGDTQRKISCSSTDSTSGGESGKSGSEKTPPPRIYQCKNTTPSPQHGICNQYKSSYPGKITTSPFQHVPCPQNIPSYPEKDTTTPGQHAPCYLNISSHSAKDITPPFEHSSCYQNIPSYSGKETTTPAQQAPCHLNISSHLAKDTKPSFQHSPFHQNISSYVNGQITSAADGITSRDVAPPSNTPNGISTQVSKLPSFQYGPCPTTTPLSSRPNGDSVQIPSYQYGPCPQDLSSFVDPRMNSAIAALNAINFVNCSPCPAYYSNSYPYLNNPPRFLPAVPYYPANVCCYRPSQMDTVYNTVASGCPNNLESGKTEEDTKTIEAAKEEDEEKQEENDEEIDVETLSVGGQDPDDEEPGKEFTIRSILGIR